MMVLKVRQITKVKNKKLAKYKIKANNLIKLLKI